jgi:uncharacterized protein (DUF2267 family)
MKLEEFLGAVKEGLELDSLREADRVVRVVVGAIKAALPDDKERIISILLPPELSAGWEQVPQLPEETFERAEMFLEEGEPAEQREEPPSITCG